MTREFHTHVDFKNNDLTNVDSVSFNTSTSDAPNAASKVVWDNGEGTLAYGLKGGTLDLNIGSEQVALCTNNTGSTIAKGKVVYINGASGNRPTIALADADADATSAQTFGVTAEDIANGAEGFVCTYGILKNIDTSAFTAGQILYLSSTAGGLTATKPSAPVHLVYVGYVISVHASSGRIFVKPQNGYELEELHNVALEADINIQNNELLAWNSADSLWKNKTASEAGIIDTSATAQTKTGNFTSSGDISAGGVLKSTQSQVNEGGQIELALPSSGSTLSTGVNIDVYQNRLRIFEAGGTNRGAFIDLSSATAGVGSDLLSGGTASPYETVTTSSTVIPTLVYTAPTVPTTSPNTNPRSQDFGSSTTGTLDLPSSLQQGDLVIVVVGSDGSAPALPSGWTNLDAQASGNGNAFQRTFYKVMTATPDTTVALSGLSTASTASVIALRGYSGTPSITTALGATGSGSPDAPSVTTTLNNSMVIAVGVLDDDGVTAVTAPTGYTNLSWINSSITTAGSDMTTMLATKVVATAGAENPDAFTTTNGSDDWVAHSIIVSPAISGADVNFDVSTSQINYYTSNSQEDFALNFRGNSTTTLNSVLSTGQSVTCALLITNGTQEYRISGVKIDGTTVAVKWLGGNTPTAGNASSIDSYVFTIIKTASATFTVLGSITKYA